MTAMNMTEFQRTEQPLLLVNTMVIAVPITTALTGFVFMQFLRFLTFSDSKTQKYARVWGSVGMFLHIVQMAIQIENVRHSFIRYIGAGSVNFFLYEGLETIFTLVIVLIVQLHFSRVTHALTAKKSWLIFSTVFLLLTSLGGLATVGLFIREMTLIGSSQDSPIRFSHHLTTAWIAWLTSATAFDLTLTVVLVRKLIECRTWTIQKTLRSCLRRLMALALETFFLTTMTSSLSMLLIAVAGFTSITDPMILARLHTVAFANNALLPRIYLISFFSTFTDPIPTKEVSTESAFELPLAIEARESDSTQFGIRPLSTITTHTTGHM